MDLPRVDRPSRDVKSVFFRDRNAWLCSLLFCICVLAAYPISNEGYVDDFSTAHTALLFAQTGHLIYDGWMAPLQGWLAPWGALFIKLFGFSFVVLRMAVLPFAIASVYLFHRILVGFGVSSRNASFGTLALFLSPMFFPLTTSFMTDMPAMFVFLLCVWMCQRAVAAASSEATIGWLVAAALINLAGGTVRQNVWLGAVVMVPCTGWLLRNRARVFTASLITGTVSVVAALGLYKWFSMHPHFFTDPAATRTLPHTMRLLGSSMLKIFLCLLLVLLPPFSAWWPTVRTLGRKALLGSAVACGLAISVILGVAARNGKLDLWTAPWLPCTVSRFNHFDTEQIDQLVCSSVTFPMWLRIGLTVLTIVSVIVVIAQIFSGAPALKRETNDACETSRSFLWILGPATFCYGLLLIPRGSSVGFLDKYVIFFLPFTIGLLLLLYQKSVSRKIPVLSFIVLALFAVDAVADAHDYYADERAREIGVRELTAAGVRMTSISRSLSSDAWQQVTSNGYIWDPSKDEPNSSSKKLGKTPAIVCATWVETRAPVVQPDYYLVFSPSSCLQPSRYPPVSYRAYLPPFQRYEYIEQPKSSAP